MRARTLIVIFLAVLTMAPLAPPIYGGMLGGLARAQGP